MREDNNLDLDAIKNLRDSFNNLKEKVANTMHEKKELLQAKCDDGLKKVSNFMKIHKNDAKTALKLSALATLIFVSGALQFNVTMDKDEYKISANTQIEKAIVSEFKDYKLTSPSNLISVKKDFFEALDETKNMVEGLQGLMEGINKIKVTRNYSEKKFDRDNDGNDLTDKYQIMDEMSKRLKQATKNKEKKELDKDASLVNLPEKAEKVEHDGTSNHDVEISIVKKLDGDKTVKIEKKDLDGDGIEDNIYIVNIEDESAKTYSAVCYNRKDKEKNEIENEDYSR